MKSFVVLTFAIGLAQALPAAAQAGIDNAGASTNSAPAANGSTMSTPKMNAAPTPGARRSPSESTQRREGLGDRKSDCVKTGCVESN